jgi:hypothetical protein
MEELNRAYDALKKAHDAGDVEGAQRIAEYARSLELQQQKAPEAEAPAETPATMSVMGIEAPLAPMAGAVIGSSVGALASPAVSGAVDTAAVRAAQAVAPGSKVIPGDVTPQAVKNWLATQTSQPYAGGDTYAKANIKAKIAAGEPIQSRGSNVPIRKGNLGISNQPPPPTLAQQAATNLLNAEKAPAPGIARRVTGMGAMGAQTGNAINEFDKGNAGRGTLATLGALAAAASQSRIKPIRALGTIGSMAIPATQMMLPEEPVPEMAAGGTVANVGSQMGLNAPFMGQEFKNIGQAMAKRQYPEAALQSGSLAYSALAPINPLTATLSALGYSSELGDATLEGYKKQQEQAARDREFEAYKRQQALQKKQKDDAFIQRFAAARPQKFDIGGKVKTAKKLLEGNFLKNYLPHTAKNPHPEVGSRFETEDLGGLLPVTPVSMESIRGKMVGTIPWDNSSRNVKINSVSGIPLTEPQVTHGGQGWVRDIEHNAANIGGANAKGAATAIQNKINAASELGEKLGGSGEVVLSPGTGAKFSDNFSVPVFNVYKDLYDQAELPKTILQKHSDFLRNVPKTNPKTKEVSYPFSNAPDINSPEMKEFALQNPNFRKQFLMEMQKPRSEKLLGYNTDDIYNAMTDPNLRDVPAGYMGHTLINVKKDAPVTPSSNSTYAYNMFGNYGGSLEHTPNEVFLNKAYNDNFNILRQKYPNAPEKKIHDMALGALDKRGEGVFELMNDEAINRIGQYHEGLKQGKFDPSDYKNALDYLKTPGVYADGGLVHLAGGGKPEKVVKAYKLFKTKANKPDELFPLFVNANKSVPLNEWVPAEVGPVAASGKVKSKLGELAYRPGWHAGDLPVATHIGGKSSPDLKAPDFRRSDEVWAEVEMPADVDWQEIANQRARLNKAGNPIPSTAHITDAIPEGGFYRYKTSPNMEGNWLIGGGMKVNRVLTDEEVMAINEAAGVADLPRFTPLPKKADGGLVHLAGGGTPLRYVSNWLLKNADELGNLPLKRPVYLNDEARLQGFTSPEQNVFYGVTKTGQEFTIPREYVDPNTVSYSNDKNKTADFVRDMFRNYKKPE